MDSKRSFLVHCNHFHTVVGTKLKIQSETKIEPENFCLGLNWPIFRQEIRPERFASDRLSHGIGYPDENIFGKCRREEAKTVAIAEKAYTEYNGARTF